MSICNHVVAQTAEIEASVFKAIADPTRRAILDELRGGDQRATDIAELFGSVSRQAIAKHLKVLDDAGLVTIAKSGRERRYGLNPMPLGRVDAWLDGYRVALASQMVDHEAPGSELGLGPRPDDGDQQVTAPA